MQRQSYAQPDIENVFEKFKKIQEAYLIQKAYNETQEEILTFERQQSLSFREKLIKATKAFLALEKVHKSSVEGLNKKNEELIDEKKKIEEENVELKEIVNQLQQQCDHFQSLLTEHNQDAERIWKLEEELEIARAKLEFQEESHKEEITSLKKRHINEMLKYKISFESARQKFRDGKRNRLKKGSNGAFRWPRLEVEKSDATQIQDETIEEVFHPAIVLNQQTTTNHNKEIIKDPELIEPKPKKRRKLFHQNHEELFDLYDIKNTSNQH